MANEIRSRTKPPIKGTTDYLIVELFKKIEKAGLSLETMTASQIQHYVKQLKAIQQEAEYKSLSYPDLFAAMQPLMDIPFRPLEEFKKQPTDLPRSARPKSLSAAVPDGPTVLGQINAEIEESLQVAQDVLIAFLETLKAQGKGLDVIATTAGSLAIDEVSKLKDELAKIGLTIQDALRNPIEAFAKLKNIKIFEKGGGIEELFKRLVLFQKTLNEEMDLAKAKARTISRFQPKETAVSTPTTPEKTVAGALHQKQLV